MNDWKDDDTVTTTYRTLAKASAEAFQMGEVTERDRIVKLLEQSLFADRGLGNVRLVDLISLIQSTSK